MRGEQAANYLRSPTKYDANTPLGVGTDSSCPYISVINSVGDCHHFVGGIHCMWGRVCHFVGVVVYAGAINRSPTAANRLPKHC